MINQLTEMPRGSGCYTMLKPRLKASIKFAIKQLPIYRRRNSCLRITPAFTALVWYSSTPEYERVANAATSHSVQRRRNFVFLRRDLI